MTDDITNIDDPDANTDGEQPAGEQQSVPADSENENVYTPGISRFASVQDITPVFNSNADAMDRLSNFISAATPRPAPQLTETLNLLKTTDQFHEIRDRAVDEMIEAFRNSGDFKKATAEWTSMDAEARLDLLNRVSDLQGRVFGFDAPRVVPFYETPKEGEIFHGRFNPELDLNGILEINIHPNSKFNSFPTALEMTLTQNTLAWLDGLADGFDNGMVSEGNPLYEQARVLSVYRGVMDVMQATRFASNELDRFIGNASAEMAEGISLEIVTTSMADTYCDLRRPATKRAPKPASPS